MAIHAKRAITESEPPGRLHAIIPVRTKQGTLTAWALFCVPLLLWSVAFPLTLLVTPLVRWRVRYYRWSAVFTALLGLGSVLGLAWYSIVFSKLLVSAYTGLFYGRWGEALAGAPWMVVAGSVFYGVCAGYVAAWWDYQRKPFYKQPDRKLTIPKFLMMVRDRELIARGEYSRKGRIALGIEDGRRSLNRVIEVSIDQMTHVLVLGTTNTGKTETCFRFAEGFIQSSAPVITLDMKGSKKTLEVMRRLAQKEGRPFYLFTLTGGGRWDPLRFKANPSAQRDLLMSVGQWSDPYYKSMANNALLDVFSALEVGGVNPGESMVQAALRLLQPAQLSQYAQQKLGAPEHAQLRSRVLARAQQMTENRGAFSGVESLLYDIVHSETGQFFVPGEGMFSLQQAYEENAVVLFSFDFMSYPITSQALSAMVLADVKSLGASLVQKKKDAPWLFWADEFTKARAGDVAPMMQQIRESGAKILLATQGRSDILDAGAQYSGGPSAYEGIVSSQASLKVYHRVEEDTALFLEKNSGEAWSVSGGSVETTRKDSLLDSDTGASGDSGRKHFEVRPAVKVSEVLSLGKGEAVMMGQFEVGYLRKDERPARRTLHQLTNDMRLVDFFNPVKVVKVLLRPAKPELIVNYCSVVRSVTAAEVSEVMVEEVNEVDASLIPAPDPVASPVASPVREVVEGAVDGRFAWPGAASAPGVPGPVVPGQSTLGASAPAPAASGQPAPPAQAGPPVPPAPPAPASPPRAVEEEGGLF